MKSRQPLTIEVTRGSMVESVHQVIFVVADRKGHITNHFGNLDYVCPPRSSLKLLQVIPLIETGAADAFKLHDKHIVLACASHKSEEHQIKAAREWLEIIKQPESVLRCGPTLPTKSPISHNCSGKHLGMVTTAVHTKIDPANYDKYEHPIQELQRRLMSDIFNMEFSKLPYGGDGCGIPTYGIPLQRLAIAMTHFLKEGLPETRRNTLVRILDAIRKYPEFLSGADDSVFRLIQATQGRAILKPGAEGTYTGIMPEKGYAFAVKAIDGNPRAAELASFYLFKHYGAITAKESEQLKEFLEPAVLDSRGAKVGVIRVSAGAQ